MNPGRVHAVMRKEFLHLARDARSLTLAFAIPVLLILLFGYALSLDVDNVTAVVVDHDRTDASRELIKSIDASHYFHVSAYLANSAQVGEYLDHGHATLGVIIPSGFDRDLKSDRKAPVQVLLDGSDPNFANITLGYINAFMQRYNQGLLVSYLNRNGLQPLNSPIDARIRVWFNEDLESRNFIIPGIIAVIIMISGAILTSLVIAREFENGTMETIKSMPLTAFEVILGKAIPYFFIALVDVLISVLMGQVLFGIVMKGSFWLMLGASSLYILVALALGLFISAAVKSQLVANQGAILVTYLPSLLLSNFVFPISNMPLVLQALTFIVPARYYINILSGIYLRDVSLAFLWQDLAVLGLMFMLLSAASVLILKKEGL